MSFQLPELHHNPPFTWGPPEEEMTLDGLEFELYKKKDPLKFVDWFNTFTENAGQTKEGKGFADFREVEDEARVRAQISSSTVKKKSDFWQKKSNKTQKKRFTNLATRKNFIGRISNTIEIPPEVTPVMDVNQSEMKTHKVRVEMENTPTTEKLYGQPYLANKAVLGATTVKPVALDEARTLNLEKEEVLKDIISEREPFIRQLTKEYTDKYPDHKIILTSDTTLAWLMTADQAENPWHVFARIVSRSSGGLIVLGSAEDVQWVGEKSAKRPSQDDKTPLAERALSLGEESTKVHQSFKVNVCSKSRSQIKTEKNPFPECHNRLYRYRAFTVKSETNGDYGVLVRCQIDVAQDKLLARAFGLLEYRFYDINSEKYDPSEWKKHPATVMASGFLTDRCKMTRWVALSLLSGANLMTVGFISRKGAYKTPPTGNIEHEIVSVKSETPDHICRNYGVHRDALWATADTVFKALFDLLGVSQDAVIMKKTDKHRIFVYKDIKVEGSDDDDDDDDEEDDDEEDDGEDSDEEEEDDDDE